MVRYRFIGSTSKDIFCIDGVNLFKYRWVNTGSCAIVLNPDTKKPYTFSIYEITLNDNKVIDFVAGKFNDTEWAFFVKE